MFLLMLSYVQVSVAVHLFQNSPTIEVKSCFGCPAACKPVLTGASALERREIWHIACQEQNLAVQSSPTRCEDHSTLHLSKPIHSHPAQHVMHLFMKSLKNLAVEGVVKDGHNELLHTRGMAFLVGQVEHGCASPLVYSEHTVGPILSC